MRVISALSAFVVAISLGQAICQAQPTIGSKPTMSFKSHDGKQVDLANLKGKMVLIDFWASWCGPCMAEADHLLEINRTWGPKGLVLIGINMDRSAGAMTSVCQQKGFTWPQYFDGQAWNNRIAKAWGVNSIPATYLIAPDGTLLWKGHSAALDPVLLDAFSKHPPQLVDPSVLAAANAALEETEKLLEQSKPAEALKAMAKADPAARADEAFATRAEEVQGKLLSHGQMMLQEIEALAEQKQFGQALTQLKDLQRGFHGTPIAEQARQRYHAISSKPEARAALAESERQARAVEALALADKLRGDEKHTEAYPRYKAIVKDLGGTEAATKAAEIVAEYEKDATFVKGAMEEAVGDKARAAMSMADSYARNGRVDAARKRYEQLIADYPGTSWAEKAQQAIEKLPK